MKDELECLKNEAMNFEIDQFGYFEFTSIIKSFGMTSEQEIKTYGTIIKVNCNTIEIVDSVDKKIIYKPIRGRITVFTQLPKPC